ncbi:ABC transporter permease [Microbacterium halotolerans]|uniref:ABC transporter permease n=1 Tax=Microbacterium halotolerans TaxID=246613 RepID=UPI001F09438C|nr:ABC transporter permease subunit [Microbacterium halotolerans]
MTQESTVRGRASLTRTMSTIALAPRRQRSGPNPVVWGTGGLALLALVLELGPVMGLVNPRFFPPLHEILQSLGAQVSTSTFWAALGSTVLGWLVGLGVATVLGVVLGVVIGSISIVDRLLSSTIEFLRPIPSVALVPLAALLFGATTQATLVLVVFASLWPILIQVVYGVRDVDRTALDIAASYRLGLPRTVAKVIWPSMMPYLIVGFRLSAAVALILEITGELIIGSPGIGNLITVAQSSAATSNMYAFVLVAALLGVVINVGVRFLERRMLFWHASVRGEGM